MKSRAFITTSPSPSVSTIKGRLNNTNSGRSTALKKLNSTTTVISVRPSSQRTPETSRVARVTPSARTSHLTTKLTNGLFMHATSSPARPPQRKTSPAPRALSAIFP